MTPRPDRGRPPRARAPRAPESDERYAALVAEEVRRLGAEPGGASDPEPLAHLSYDLEQRAKATALVRWWGALGFEGMLEPLVAAVEPRGYRATSKRRIRRTREGLSFGFVAESAGRPAGVTPTPSRLDHPSHLPVYRELADRLGRPSAAALAEVLTWVVVRGTDEALTVILNVVRLDAPVIRTARRIEGTLAQLGVRSLLLYLDPTGSDYYLEAKRPPTALGVKVMSGSEWLDTEIGGVRFRHPAVSFAQINQAMVPTLVETVDRLAGPLEQTTLLDCYCGWGLFAFTVGRRAEAVLGVDHDGPAIAAAQRTGKRLGPKYRFIAAAVDQDFVRDRLRRARGREVVILDPPRQGTAKGLAAALAEREPARVVHVCCGIGELPRELAAWGVAGWAPDRVVALDLFPGTTSIEVVVALHPASPRASSGRVRHSHR